MIRPLRISEEADAELTAAVRWYELHRPGLGRDFLTVIDAVLARIRDGSATGIPVSRVEEAGIRRVFVQRFPYHVVYLELADRIQVLAIAHDRRRPGYRVGRLPD